MNSNLPKTTKHDSMNVCLSILAGGDSRRMGQDKALKPFLGKPLIQHVITRVSGLADEMLVVTNHKAGYSFLGLPLVSDLLPGRGALGGLYTSLVTARSPFLAVLACDMPFASLEIFKYECEMLERENLDAILPIGPHGIEPLHAVYRRQTCLPAVRSALETSQMKLISWLPQVKYRYLSKREIAEITSSSMTFLNLNTQEEFSLAENYF